ncbi:hypothetical protein SBADM41S_10456 [Streptomyces badius]
MIGRGTFGQASPGPSEVLGDTAVSRCHVRKRATEQALNVFRAKDFVASTHPSWGDNLGQFPPPSLRLFFVDGVFEHGRGAGYQG